MLFIRNGQALGSILFRDAPKAARPKKQTPATPEPQPEKAAPAPEPESQPEPAKAAPAAKSAAPHKSTPSKEAK